MAIPQETIELVRERAQIEEIVKRYLPLEKKGNNYIALCPFHKEKTPSFSVSPEKQIFYCFGCHVGGNVFSFISKVEGLTFPESVKFVGKLIGIEVEDKWDNKSNIRDNNLKKQGEINRFALELYHNLIFAEQGKLGLDYIINRGVTEERIKEFKIGFAPDSWNYLTNQLNRKNLSLDLSFEIGLTGSKDKRKYYDKFRNRVMFPIINHRNEVVAFGARSIDGSDPKYINSPESLIYKKRDVLYGLNIAKPFISEYRRSIVVEGYLDVIGCHQAGIKNTVAPLGTALTPEQVKLLSRYCKEVILLFDADSAGIKASLRSINVFKDVNIEVKIAVLPEHDPFEFIMKKGARELMSVIDNALEPIDYQLKTIAAANKGKGKVTVLLEMFKIISNTEYQTEKREYLKKVSSILGIPENSVINDFNKFQRKDNKSKKALFNTNENPGGNAGKQDFLIKSYREIVILLCNFPELFEQAVMDFAGIDFPDPASRNIFLKLRELYSNNEKISIDKMYDCFPDGEEKYILERIHCPIEDSESANIDYTKRYLRIKVEYISKKIEYYTGLINNPGNVSRKDLDGYWREYQILQKERDRLSVYL